MKVLGISGSPRKGGNSDVLLEKALEGARSSGAETGIIYLRDLNFSPIQEEEYEKVNDDGLSVIDDDMQLVFKKIDEAGVLILASPIFFGSLSSQAKMMIDRFQCVWLAKNIFHKEIFTETKKGAFISVEATTRDDFFQSAKSIVRHFFATINMHYEDELFCPGIDKKTGAAEHPEYLEKAFELGRNIVS